MPRHNANLAIHFNSHRFNEIQQTFLIQPTHFVIFSVLWINSGGTKTKNIKKQPFGDASAPHLCAVILLPRCAVEFGGVGKNV